MKIHSRFISHPVLGKRK